jgi:hypothetical protein
MAGQIAPGDGREATPERLSVYGLQLLQGAMAAARLGDSATVRDLLGGAEEAAKQLGGDENYYWTSFGPTNVAFHRAAADVEMGEGGRAVEIHEAIDPLCFTAMMPERRAHHLLDLSRGLAQIGDIGRASETRSRRTGSPQRDPLPPDRARAGHGRVAADRGAADGVQLADQMGSRSGRRISPGSSRPGTARV